MLKLRFQPFPELVTERLLLRQLNLADAPEIFFLRSDKKALQFVGREPAKSVKEAEAYIKVINQNVKENEAILWGIALRSKPGTIIGTICYWQMQKENYRTEIGYMLNPEYWQKGIMKEGLQKVLEYGFNSLKLHSIEARVHPDNKASVALLESAGFNKEGHFKEDFYFRGRFEDTLVYAKLSPLSR
jgi:ribosomal-protein-alanine N-acetyltransferase